MRTVLVLIFAAAVPGHAAAQPPATLAWKPVAGQLMTKWAADVKPDAPLPEYPRPQMTRAKWQSLNGPWDYALVDLARPLPGGEFAGKILVPFPLESALSGVKKAADPAKRLWYRRTFTVPADWAGQRIKLHFGAVNYECGVLVNGHPVGSHVGGYDGFCFDITDALKPGDNEILVSAANPLRCDVEDAQVLGKQRLKSGSIFYTSATGIWQTVWIEPVPAAHITALKITPDVDKGVVRIKVEAENAEGLAAGIVLDTPEGVLGTVAECKPNEEFSLKVPNARLWTPDDPHLYQFKAVILTPGAAAAVTDQVGSYFAMRKISLGNDDKGRLRILLNNKFVFQMGALDQGYWPDGLYTAPTDEALRYDVEIAKKLGFNLLRKHAKVEPQRWYYHADKLGMLVWQDMPQMFSAKGDKLSAHAKHQFEAEWRRILRQFHNAPSIVVWTPFNEGWGQHDTGEVTALTKRIDPSRLVNQASGWTDKGFGDIDDVHNYPDPKTNSPSAKRAAVCGEFGGLGMQQEDHMWGDDAWGYQGVYTRNYPLTRHYQRLMKMAHGMVESQGMSAVVYTQLTDVEQEVNGLLTYDRAVIKPMADIATAANLGKFPPLPRDPDPDLVPTSQDEAAKWRYSFDKPKGTEWAQPTYDDSSWKVGEAPFGNNVAGVRTAWTTSDITIRREVNLPEKVPARLEFLIQHDEDAEVYVNGVLAAKVAGYVGDFKRIPVTPEGLKAFKPGKNTIAVHCHNTIGGQGIDVGIAEVKGPRK